MKRTISEVGDLWKSYFVTIIFTVSILQNSDVSAVSHKKSASKASSYLPGHGNTAIHANYSPGKRIPSSILAEIRSLDNHLLCFPKLLCTIYQDRSIAKRNVPFNATELGVAYIKLLKAVHYMSPTASTAPIPPAKVKQPIIQIFQIPTGIIKSSTYSGRNDHHHDFDGLEDYPYHLRSPLQDVDHDDDNVIVGGGGDDYNLESENPLGDDDEGAREFLREKIEISQLMHNLKEEDEAEYAQDSSTSRDSPASSLLNSFLPFMGSRSIKGGSVAVRSRGNYQRKDRRRRVPVITHAQNERKRRPRNQPRVSQDPFWKAVSLWKKLKSRSQCTTMYATCPLESWEIVRMLDLVKGQSEVLSAYLKITVDKVKPSRLRS